MLRGGDGDEVHVSRVLRIFVVAGEPSGDRLGGYLLKAMHAKVAAGDAPGFERMDVLGVGGMRMQEQGLSSVFPMSFLSNNGVADVLRWVPQTLKCLDLATAKAMEFDPHIIVTIDSKGFNLRLLSNLRQKYKDGRYVMPPCIQYVAPSFWAFKDGESRLADLRRVADHVLCILPFEPRGLRRFNITGTFVGHPSVEEELMRLAFQPKDQTGGGGPLGSRASESAAADARAWLWEKFEKQLFKHEVPSRSSRGPTVALLPGSRLGEVKRLLPRMYDAALHITRRLVADDIHKTPQFVVLAAPEVEAEIKQLLGELKLQQDQRNLALGYTSGSSDNLPRNLHNIHVVSEEKFPVLHTRALSACDVAIAASGTVTVQLALLDIPTVVVYCSDAVTEFLAPAVVKIPYAALPNVILLAQQHLDRMEELEAKEKEAKARAAAKRAAAGEEGNGEEPPQEEPKEGEEEEEEEEDEEDEEDDGYYREEQVTFVRDSDNATSSVVRLEDIHAANKPYPVYPELLGSNECTGANIAQHAVRLLNLSPDARHRMQQQLNQVVSMLNIPHQLPSENAAEVVLKYATSSTYMVNV